MGGEGLVEVGTSWATVGKDPLEVPVPEICARGSRDDAVSC